MNYSGRNRFSLQRDKLPDSGW